MGTQRAPTTDFSHVILTYDLLEPKALVRYIKINMCTKFN